MELELGDIDPYTDIDYLLSKMREWVALMDVELKREFELNGYSSRFDRMLKARLVTYEEYQDLFKNIKPIDFKYYKSFVTLDIKTTDKLEGFKFNYSNDKVSYAGFVSAHTTHELDVFLRNLRKAIMPYQDALAHMYIPGKSGSGKSTLINGKIYQIQRDYKVSQILLDPHGDLPLSVKKSNLNYQNDKVVYFDYRFKEGRLPVFNPFRVNDRRQDNLIMYAQGLQTSIEIIMEEELTLNMRALLEPCIFTLVQKGDSSIQELQRFMDDKRNKDLVQLGLQSPLETHRSFFTNFYDNSKTVSKNAIAAKLQILLSKQDFFEVTTGDSTFDLEKIINSEGGLMIFNLGGMGRVSRKAFGRLIIGAVIGFVEKRKFIQEEFRPHTFFWIDECQNFVSEAIITGLDETRKWGLHLGLANQYVEQLKEMKESVYSNTAIKIVGLTDSPETNSFLQKLIGADKDFKQMKKHEFLCKISGKPHFFFKSNAMFVYDPSYRMTASQETEFDRDQLQYYSEVDTEVVPPPPPVIREEYEADEDDR